TAWGTREEFLTISFWPGATTVMRGSNRQQGMSISTAFGSFFAKDVGGKRFNGSFASMRKKMAFLMPRFLGWTINSSLRIGPFERQCSRSLMTLTAGFLGMATLAGQTRRPLMVASSGAGAATGRGRAGAGKPRRVMTVRP